MQYGSPCRTCKARSTARTSSCCSSTRVGTELEAGCSSARGTRTSAATSWEPLRAQRTTRC
eukprot:9888668-Heterocapsa_arctica.AAC.1